MNVSIIVPYRPSDRARVAAAGWVLARWAALRPWEIVVRDAPTETWSKSRAANAAVADATGDVLVITDADVTVDNATLDRLDLTVPWSQPFETVTRLARTHTATVLASDPAHPVFPSGVSQGRRAVGGGLLIVRRDLYEQIGGWDERFEGWGAEDTWLGRELTRHAGPPATVDATLWHLWHPRDPDRRATPSYARNRRLLRG